MLIKHDKLTSLPILAIDHFLIFYNDPGRFNYTNCQAGNAGVDFTSYNDGNSNLTLVVVSYAENTVPYCILLIQTTGHQT